MGSLGLSDLSLRRLYLAFAVHFRAVTIHLQCAAENFGLRSYKLELLLPWQAQAVTEIWGIRRPIIRVKIGHGVDGY